MVHHWKHKNIKTATKQSEPMEASRNSLTYRVNNYEMKQGSRVKWAS